METKNFNVSHRHSATPVSIDRESVMQAVELQRSIKSSASWFYWIAALSVINTIIIMFNGQWSFIVGLGVTLVMDIILKDAVPVIKMLGYMFNIVAVGTCVFFGFFAAKRKRWAFIVGSVLYGLDGILFLLWRDWFAVGFHVFAVIMILSGLKKIWKLEALEAKLPAYSSEAGFMQTAAQYEATVENGQVHIPREQLLTRQEDAREKAESVSG